ncbi:leukocidin family pore-forming toxin [Photobacterium leiognathi]|uniref:leukocidin family pore-forming toxin n=1 Tax=Photobacterium leiognathi TaxID=553611 RepID=UPI002980F24B|nr:leukocidin family pore-forming toxin [Photobacterium leiognathi]
MKIFRSVKFAIKLIFISLCCSSVFAYGEQPQGLAVNMLSQLQDSSQVDYINAESWLVDETLYNNEGLSSNLEQITTNILENNKRALVDFSSIVDESKKDKAKQLFRKQIGISFPEDYLVITKHKNELMFAPVEGNDDSSIELLDAHDQEENSFNGNVNKDSSKSEHASLPHLSFYLMVKRRISPWECTFRSSTLWHEYGKRRYCYNAHISLIYRVNLQRSLAFGSVAGETPDAKIVRITLDDSASGAGIHLNDSLVYRFYKAPYFLMAGYLHEWSTSAIAQDYTFSFNASNNKAIVLKTVPRNNLNTDYEKKEVSGFTLGVTAGTEMGVTGPKVKSDVTASYTQSRWLTFKTQDYRVERSTNGHQNVSFKWNRHNYATAKSLLNRSTDAVWVRTFPADLDRINPIGYKGFVPTMDVIFKAAPEALGATTFSVGSSVNIRPIYHLTYHYFYLFGMHLKYYGTEESPRRRISKNVRFTVDWKHPVFTGGRLVYLQLKSFNDRCIESSTSGTILTRTCNQKRVSQSFIYDKHGRYVSAKDTSLCLDGDYLNQLKQCDMRLSQRWQWVKGSDKLMNVYSGNYLGYNKSTGQLGLYTQGTQQISLGILTDHTDYFEKISQG